MTPSTAAHRFSSMTVPQGEDIQLEAYPNRSEHDQTEAQPVSNAVDAVTPLELTSSVRLKVFSAAFCFLNAGINDGSIGALIPYILRDYHITTGWMAIPCGVAFFGWLLTAVLGGYLRVTLGTGGYLIVGAAMQLLGQLLRFWTPPFGVCSLSFFLVALGQAFQDSQANTFVSSIKKAHRWLGLIHDCYALGCLVGPLVAAAIASNLNGQWATFYVSNLKSTLTIANARPVRANRHRCH